MHHICVLSAVRRPPGLIHLFHNVHLVLQAAADWLIECEDIASAVRHWRADKEQQQEADQQSAFEQKRKKQDLLHRWGVMAQQQTRA